MYKNRAAVIIWSGANETADRKRGTYFLLKLVKHVESLDLTRLISAASSTRSENGVSIVDDKIGEAFDILDGMMEI